MTVRGLQTRRAVVRDLRGHELHVYYMARTPRGTWLVASEMVGDVRCRELAEEHARPGRPIERA